MSENSPYMHNQIPGPQHRIHHAMLSRGYSEEYPASVYFTGPVPSRDLRLGLLMTALPLMVLTINYLV